MPSGVSVELPDRTNINQIIQRERWRRTPRNPRILDELHEIPDHFRNTKVGEFEDEHLHLDCDRITVLSTRGNIRLLTRIRINMVRRQNVRTAPK